MRVRRLVGTIAASVVTALTLLGAAPAPASAEAALPQSGEISGTYTLTEDVTATGQYTVTGDTTINLNGHTLTDGRDASSAQLFTVSGHALTISGSDAQSNKVTSANGGELVRAETGSTVTLDKVTVSGFKSQADGGVIFAQGSKVNVTGSTFSGNSGNQGGVIRAGEGSAVTVDGSTFSNNSATYNGGAIWTNNSTVTLSGEASSFEGNAANENGGAIYGEGTSTISVTGATFKNGSAKQSGGAIFAKDTSKVTVSGGAITSNSAAVNGGAISANNSTIAVSNRAAFTSNSAAGLGGAVYANGSSTVSATGATFTQNSSKIDSWNAGGGAIAVEGVTSLTVTSSTLNGNEALRGGAVFASGTPTAQISGSAFSENSATVENQGDTGGGAVYVIDSVLAVSQQSTFQGNVARSVGGAICAIGKSNVSIDGSTLSGNKSWMYQWATGGGAVFQAGEGNLALTGNTTLDGNVAKGSGGAVLFSSTGSFTMNGAIVNNNRALIHEGGGLALIKGHSVISSGTITGNTTGYNEDGTGEYAYGDNKGYEDWGGGGVFVSDQGATLVIPVVADIENNDAGGFGGGVAACATGRIFMNTADGKGALVTNNTASGQNTSGSGSAKHEDHDFALDSKVFMNNGYQDIYAGLAANISPNRPDRASAQWSGSVDGNAYTSTSDSEPIICSSVVGLTSGNKNGISGAAVTIKNNKSWTHGGGILVNGTMVTGTPTDFTLGKSVSLTGKKLITDGTQNAQDIQCDHSGFTANVYDKAARADDGTLGLDEKDIVSVGTSDKDGTFDFDRTLVFNTRTLPDVSTDAEKPTVVTYYVAEGPSSDPGFENDATVYELEFQVYAATEDFETGSAPSTVKKTTYRLKQYTSEDGTVLGDVKVTKHENGRAGADDAISYASLDRCWNGSSWDESHIALIKAEDAPSFTNMIAKASTKVSTVWDDDDNKANKRPSSFDVTIEGTANGTSVFSKKVTLNEGNGWSYSWDELPTYATDGSKISYSVASDSLPNGYTTTIAGDVENGFTVTHSLHLSDSDENNGKDDNKDDNGRADNGGDNGRADNGGDNGRADNGGDNGGDNGRTDIQNGGQTDNGTTDNNAGETADAAAKPSAAPAAKAAAKVPNTGDATNGFVPLALGIVATVSLVGALVKRRHG